METITTKKTDYYLTDEELGALEDASSIIGKLMLTHGEMIKDYTYYVEGSKKTLKGEDLESCFWALNDLTYMLENSNHAYRVKSLEDYNDVVIDYTNI